MEARYELVGRGEIVNFLPDGIVCAAIPVLLDKKAANIFIKELKAILFAEDKKFLVLTDITMMEGMPTIEAKQIIVEGIKKNKHKIAKSAICGFSSIGVIAARLIITLAGRGDIKIFKTREEALNWLKS